MLRCVDLLYEYDTGKSKSKMTVLDKINEAYLGLNFHDSKPYFENPVVHKSKAGLKDSGSKSDDESSALSSQEIRQSTVEVSLVLKKDPLGDLYKDAVR
jgi:hypothetical protein